MGLLSGFRNFARKLLEEPRPCFRCGTVRGTHPYAGYVYCRICADVVSFMHPQVAHDPPFGFPGGGGYTTFVKKAKVEGEQACPPPAAPPSAS